MGFALLNDAEEKEFRRLSNVYWREAAKCETAKARLASSIMVGSWLEAMLVLMVNAHSDVVERRVKLPQKHGKPKPLLEWTLKELLDVAMTAGWLPEDKFGPYLTFLRTLRNFVHPKVYCEEHRRGRITPKLLQRQFDIALWCKDWLAGYNADILMRDFQEGKF